MMKLRMEDKNFFSLAAAVNTGFTFLGFLLLPLLLMLLLLLFEELGEDAAKDIEHCSSQIFIILLLFNNKDT